MQLGPSLLSRRRRPRAPSLFVDDDPEPLEIHRIEVELTVRLEDLGVVDARVGFETHPYETCPVIAESYRPLIGLNIARKHRSQSPCRSANALSSSAVPTPSGRGPKRLLFVANCHRGCVVLEVQPGGSAP